jgi:Raf kinase inhibitor-like YbhB/YbcL family protein
MRRWQLGTMLVVALALSFTAMGPIEVGSAPAEPAAEKLEIFSPDFPPDGDIPKKFTCEGRDHSPVLEFYGIPEQALTLALVLEDPDASGGTFVHWVMYNIPARREWIPGDFPVALEIPDGTRQGANSSRRIGYVGPCPPTGMHRYFFRLYAVDIVLDLPPGANKAQLMRALKNHVLDSAYLKGWYQMEEKELPPRRAYPVSK